MPTGQPELERLARDLGRAPFKAVAFAAGAVAATLHDIKTTARADAPQYSGRYARSIDYTASGLKGEVGPRSRYGHLVEKGGARSAPNPVMKRATEANEQKFDDRLAQAIASALW